MQSAELLKSYFNGVLGRADHHAKNVEQIALTLMGAVIWKSTGDIEVREVKDSTGNILWFECSEKRYAFCYNHSTGKIDLRERTLKGNTIHEFDNSSSAAEVFAIFKDL